MIYIETEILVFFGSFSKCIIFLRKRFYFDHSFPVKRKHENTIRSCSTIRTLKKNAIQHHKPQHDEVD
jgi:hypothetical protein